MDPGYYSVSADRPTYSRLIVGSHWQNHTGSSLELVHGDHLSGITLKLQPQGLIAGTVLTVDGKPLIAADLDCGG